mmetsp:Transcript_29008/g.66654  ORF Transcript_29008/g.66654 Transcript_29008/m.66654 type:complete len:249 (+) Transcript_29008:124-870(+)
MTYCRKSRTTNGNVEASANSSTQSSRTGMKSLKALEQEFLQRSAARKAMKPSHDVEHMKQAESAVSENTRCYSREEILAVMSALQEAGHLAEDKLGITSSTTCTSSSSSASERDSSPEESWKPDFRAPPGLEDMILCSNEDLSNWSSRSTGPSDSASNDDNDESSADGELETAVGMRADAPAFEPHGGDILSLEATLCHKPWDLLEYNWMPEAFPVADFAKQQQWAFSGPDALTHEVCWDQGVAMAAW